MSTKPDPAEPATTPAAAPDAVAQNLELVIERLKDIRHLGPQTHFSDLAKEALVCARAALAAVPKRPIPPLSQSLQNSGLEPDWNGYAMAEKKDAAQGDAKHLVDAVTAVMSKHGLIDHLTLTATERFCDELLATFTATTEVAAQGDTAAAPQVAEDERAARIESALARLLASDPTTAACSEVDLSAAVNDASAPPFVREQAAAMLAARAALAAAPAQSDISRIARFNRAAIAGWPSFDDGTQFLLLTDVQAMMKLRDIAARQQAADERTAFEAHYREDCGMPEEAEFNWEASFIMAAWDGWQAGRAALAAAPAQPVAAPDAGIVNDANRYQHIKRFCFHRTMNGYDKRVTAWNLHIAACEDDPNNLDAALDIERQFHGEKPFYAAPAAQGDAKELTDERIYDIAASCEIGIGHNDHETSQRFEFARAILAAIAASKAAS